MEYLLFFILLGIVVGFFSGLLGIGGGAIMFPAYTFIFSYMQFPIEKVIYLALGTSMSSIIITSMISAYSHSKKEAILETVLKKMLLGIVIGTFVGALLIPYIPYYIVAIIFSLYTFLIAIQMFFGINILNMGNVKYFKISLFIGFFSSLVSIGGGTLTVPYLVNKNIDIKKAIATSSVIGLTISIVGTVGYILSGIDSSMKIENSYVLGFIYFPAFIVVSLMSLISVPIGVNLVHRLPIELIKKIFACLLILLCIKLFIKFL